MINILQIVVGSLTDWWDLSLCWMKKRVSLENSKTSYLKELISHLKALTNRLRQWRDGLCRSLKESYLGCAEKNSFNVSINRLQKVLMNCHYI